jgi:hypothetical protein
VLGVSAQAWIALLQPLAHASEGGGADGLLVGAPT